MHIVFDLDAKQLNCQPKVWYILKLKKTVGWTFPEVENNAFQVIDGERGGEGEGWGCYPSVEYLELYCH